MVTTHFDQLKFLAMRNTEHYRNGSMEFSAKDNLPTYQLLLDIPGQSYGFELAARVGIKNSLINRAKEIKGTKDNSLSCSYKRLVSFVMGCVRKSKNLKNNWKQTLLAEGKLRAETPKLKESRQKEINSLRGYYEQKLGKKI